MSNKVSISNRQKVVKIPSGMRLLVRRSCNGVLLQESFPHPVEISVSFVDNAEIRRINTQHRGKDEETDVLSFPLCEKGNYQASDDRGTVVLGDIVI